jgi:uncharacterized protein
MQLSATQKVDKILTEVTQWVRQHSEISAVALVGSWARGTARTDSDVDLMFLTLNPATFRSNKQWMGEINWQSVGSEVKRWQDADYGVVWSRHVHLGDGTKIEFGFGFPSWASVDPIDLGTLGVVSNGCRILYDPEGLFDRLLEQVKSQNFGQTTTN